MSTSPQLTPQRILTTLQAYRDSAALNTAVQLDLFTRIAHGTDTPHKIAGEMGIPVRGVLILCEYLAATGLLEKEDEQLKLTPESAAFLDRKSTKYVGTAVESLNSPQLLRDFGRLTDSVRAGKSVSVNASVFKGRPDWFGAARGIADPAAAAALFAEAVNFPPGDPLKILDVGAQDGLFGIALANRYPKSVIVALDSPEALREAQVNADAAKLRTRYQNIPGDPLDAPLGLEYDAVIIAEKLYQFEPAQITTLFMRIRYALKKGGRLVIVEFLSDETPQFAKEFVAFRLNLLAATPRGDVYSQAEVKGMLESSGFKSIEMQPLPALRATLVTGRP
ncbi:MAG TPA: class I SAM-dependent methyltransferase [Bryobacteraceae bacterium]